MRTGDICEACIDMPGWQLGTDTCYSASCADEKVKGFSSNEACCKCGGGHRAATPFTYFVGGIVLGADASTVVGYPIPRTASHYLLNEDCELTKYGLTIDGATGELQLADTCTQVGCGTITESFTVSCTITANQSASLMSSAELVVSGLTGFSYRAGPLIFYEEGESYMPTFHAPSSSTLSFDSLICSPADVSAALTLSPSTGELAWAEAATAVGGVAGVPGVGSTKGAICLVSASSTSTSSSVIEYTAPVVVLRPEVWSLLGYGYDGALYATLGEASILLRPVEESGKLPPSRFSARINAGSDGYDDSAFSFDVLTGYATYKNHILFHLDVSTGSFRLGLWFACKSHLF